MDAPLDTDDDGVTFKVSSRVGLRQLYLQPPLQIAAQVERAAEHAVMQRR